MALGRLWREWGLERVRVVVGCERAEGTEVAARLGR